jgi:hypothetical protein
MGHVLLAPCAYLKTDAVTFGRNIRGISYASKNLQSFLGPGVRNPGVRAWREFSSGVAQAVHAEKIVLIWLSESRFVDVRSVLTAVQKEELS